MFIVFNGNGMTGEVATAPSWGGTRWVERPSERWAVPWINRSDIEQYRVPVFFPYART